MDQPHHRIQQQKSKTQLMEQLATDIYVSKDHQTLITFSCDSREDIGKVEKVNGTNRKIKKWGSKNDLPLFRDQLIMKNNIVGQLIATKADILLGQGLVAYKEVFKDGTKQKEFISIPNEVSTWMEENEIWEQYFEPAALNYYKQANVFTEFRKDGNGKVKDIRCMDSKYMRICQKLNGRIKFFAYCSDWSNPGSGHNKEEVTIINAYEPNSKKAKFIIHVGDKAIHDGYYYHPTYWGGDEWIELSNMIPIFHKHNIKNGYTIRFHIKFPPNYFVNKAKLSAAGQDSDLINKCYEEAEKAKKDFLDKFNKIMAGEVNAGRTIHSVKVFNKLTKQYEGIEIEEVKYEMKDESLLKLFESSNNANVAAQGIHPSLASIQTQGKMSSGSEIRNSFLFYIITKTWRARNTILKPFLIALKENGWHDPSIKYTFEDFMMTTLDDDKSGKKKVEENEDNGE